MKSLPIERRLAIILQRRFSCQAYSYAMAKKPQKENENFAKGISPGKRFSHLPGDD
jgi:hypothetical protein